MSDNGLTVRAHQDGTWLEFSTNSGKSLVLRMASSALRINRSGKQNVSALIASDSPDGQVPQGVVSLHTITSPSRLVAD